MTNDLKPQKPKKSETLEVRIPYDTKQAFLTACREDGTTASEVVRDNIQSYLDARERPQPQERPSIVQFAQFAKKLPPIARTYGPRAAAGGLAAVALATFAALPSAAAPDFQSQFKRLDLNGDGVITAEEFAGKPGANADDVTVETRVIHMNKDGKDITIEKSGKPLQLKQEAFSFVLPEELAGAADNNQNTEYRFATATQIHNGKDGDAAADGGPLIISHEGLRKQEFDAFDTDKDGKVSFSEFQARQKAMLTRGFEMLDANGDKSLSQEEYSKIGSPPLPKIDGLDAGKGRRIQIISDEPKFSEEKIKAAFTRLDANKDAKLSLQEYLPPA